MLHSGAHLLVAAASALLAVAIWRTWGRFGRTYTLIVLVVALVLVYENAVLGIGRWIGHGDLLEQLSWARVPLHAVSTPLLVITGFGALRDLDIRWAEGRRAHAAACLVAVALVAWGVVVDLVLLDLEPQASHGVVSYGNGLGVPPVPAIVTTLALIGAGLVIWRSYGWPWLALGAVAMLGASGLGGISPLLTHLGELALLGALAATEREAGQRSIHWSITARHPSRPRWPDTAAAGPR